ncbi:60S ribosomal protein L27, mitochondrial, partial [Coemansia sp. S17]
MTAKKGRNFYKGNRTGSMGSHTKHGKYVVDLGKVRTYVVPDLTGCELRPYVSHRGEMLKVDPCSAAAFTAT